MGWVLRSRAISARNVLFKKGLELLMTDGLEESEARETVRTEMREEGRRRGGGARHRPGVAMKALMPVSH